jgi:hypothetical protein
LSRFEERSVVVAHEEREQEYEYHHISNLPWLVSGRHFKLNFVYESGWHPTRCSRSFFTS